MIWLATSGSLDNMFDTLLDSKVHGANMGPTWVLSAPDGPHVASRNLATRATDNPTATIVDCVAVYTPIDCAYNSHQVGLADNLQTDTHCSLKLFSTTANRKHNLDIWVAAVNSQQNVNITWQDVIYR